MGWLRYQRIGGQAHLSYRPIATRELQIQCHTHAKCSKCTGTLFATRLPAAPCWTLYYRPSPQALPALRCCHQVHRHSLKGLLPNTAKSACRRHTTCVASAWYVQINCCSHGASPLDHLSSSRPSCNNSGAMAHGFDLIMKNN